MAKNLTAVPSIFNSPGTGDGDDGTALVAAPPTASTRVAFLYYKRGIYAHGASRDPLPLGTRFVYRSVRDGWIRLQKGEPVQRKWREAGILFPRREELGDVDQAHWPISPFNGQPTDPWKFTVELFLIQVETGQPTILSLNTATGCEAAADLCRLISHQRLTRGPTARPIIALKSETQKRGPYMVDIPVFEIVEWLSSSAEPVPSPLANEVIEHLQTRSMVDGTATSTAPLPRPRRQKKAADPAPWEDDDLDDAIPSFD
jgi:hypothetical protein